MSQRWAEYADRDELFEMYSGWHYSTIMHAVNNLKCGCCAKYETDECPLEGVTEDGIYRSPHQDHGICDVYEPTLVYDVLLELATLKRLEQDD